MGIKRSIHRWGVGLACCGALMVASPALASDGPEASPSSMTGASGTSGAAGASPAIPAQERLPLGVAQPNATTDAGAGKSATPSGIAGSSLQVSLALAIVIGIIVGIGVVVRKVAARGGGLMSAMGPGGKSPSGVIEVLGRFPLARGMTLVLLKLDRRVLLVSMGLGRGGGNMQTLCEISDPDEVASLLLRTRDETGESIARQFAGLLQREDQEAQKALKITPRPTPAQPSAARPTPAPRAANAASPARAASAMSPKRAVRPTLEVRA